MAEEIDVMKIERDQHLAQIRRQTGDAVAAGGLVRFTVAALIEGDNAPLPGQGADLMFEFGRALRPAGQHHQRLAFAGLAIAERYPTGNRDRFMRRRVGHAGLPLVLLIGEGVGALGR